MAIDLDDLLLEDGTRAPKHDTGLQDADWHERRLLARQARLMNAAPLSNALRGFFADAPMYGAPIVRRGTLLG